MADKVRIAFIGIGWWSNMLADAAKKSSRIEIAAGCSRSEEKRSKFADKYGCMTKQKYEDIISDKNIDAVVLTTPNTLHAPQAILAAKNKKHIFVEKPMALTVSECREMVKAADEAGVVLMIGHNSRRLARFRKAEELIKKGMIGQVILVESSSTGELGNRLNPDIWRYYRKESPGGPLTSFTVHHTDNMNHLVGPVKRVSAFVNKLCGPAECDDVVSATVEFENGALGYIGSSFITADRNTFQIHGTEGVVYVDEESGTFYQKKGTEEMVKCPVPHSDVQRLDSLAEEMEEFARCIQTGEKPETTGLVGLNAVAILEAIVKSQETGAIINIKDL